MTKSEVVDRFGDPLETTYDTNFTHWIYRTYNKAPQSGVKRQWLIKYSFQGETLVEIASEMVPTPDELKEIEAQAQERLKKTSEKAGDEGSFKEL